MAQRIRAVEGVSTAWQWNLGDLLVYGEDRYGQDASQTLDELVRAGVDRKYLNNMEYTSRRIGPPMRIEGLSWTHHYLAASIPNTADRRLWLGRAAKDKLNTKDFQKAIKPLKESFKKPKAVREMDEDSDQGDHVSVMLSGETYSQLCAITTAWNEKNLAGDTPEEFIAGWIEKAYLALPERSSVHLSVTCSVCGGPRDIPLARGGFLSQCKACRNKKRRVA